MKAYLRIFFFLLRSRFNFIEMIKCRCLCFYSIFFFFQTFTLIPMCCSFFLMRKTNRKFGTCAHFTTLERKKKGFSFENIQLYRFNYTLKQIGAGNIGILLFQSNKSNCLQKFLFLEGQKQKYFD